MKSFIVVVLVVAVMLNFQVEGQGIPPCVTNLVGCVDYLNTTTTPPATCCVPLKEAITDQLPCLCNVYNDPAFLKSLGINVTQAIELPARCGIAFSISECSGSPAPSPFLISPMPQMQPGGSTTPGNPTTPSAPSPSSAGQSAAATFSCLFIMAAAVLYLA
ncbi:hypothetical protein DCAR_0207668 [Daucus carota subsp. sativus]|uniref:Uncharacterized protein n=1 Tax=Daucus carota subsp. sativus TaxID=79200 RepID=A0A166E1R2_DAUCS|nr:PREDICTED: lipid transfer-like protein VAS [Daucus carota subsp. sativus]WOG88433.1 hypothetical protein DCAR_0207668 [Daucus carota subsp. sativus]